jgi:hypothetical protein
MHTAGPAVANPETLDDSAAADPAATVPKPGEASGASAPARATVKRHAPLERDEGANDRPAGLDE